LYHGSAGGTGYDLAWAQDTNGNNVNIPIVRYVRVTVLGNKSEIDALSAVGGTLPVIADDFYTDPALNGWKYFGNTNLFHWNPTNHNVEVTWDSTQTNSYLYHPLGTVLTADDAFSLSFDLQMNDAVAFNGGQEAAIGFINLASATNSSFSRATGSSPNLLEFDYFPDTGFGDSLAATLIDTNGDFGHNYFIFEDKSLLPGITYQVILNHAAGSTILSCQVLTNGVLYSALPGVFAGPITDFRLDAIAIDNFTDDGFDSVLAHGAVKNFVVSLPPPPVQNLAGRVQGGQWQAQFLSRTNWSYTLLRSADLLNWTTATNGIAGNGTNMIVVDPATPVDQAFYRIRADRP